MTSSPARTVWRDVWFLATAQAFTGLGAAAITTLLLLDAKDDGGWAVMAVIIAAALPTVLLAPLTGWLADRLDSRLLLVVSGVLQVGACPLIAAAPTLTGKVGALLLLCTGSALSQPVRAALLPAMVTPDDLPRASAIGQTAYVLGPMGGPPLAGFAHALGTDPTIRWASLAYLSTILLGLVLRTRRGETDPARPGSWRSEPKLPLDGLLRVTFLGLGAVIMTVSVVNVAEILFIQETLGASDQVFGVVTAMFPVGMVAGAWGLARLADRARDDGALVLWLFVGLGGIALFLVLLAGVGSVIWVVPIWLASGALNGAINVLLTTLMGRRAAPEARGRVAAIMQATLQGSTLIGYVLGGFATATTDYRTTILVSGVLGLIAVIVILPWVRATITQLRGRTVGVPE